MKKLTIIILIVALTNVIVLAQNVDNFALTDALDNKSVSLIDYSDAEAVVVIFMVNNCPFADYYIDRIKQFEKEYGPKNIAVLLVNSHLDQSPESMKAYAKKHGIVAPYLADKKQEVLKLMGAKKSPSVVVLKKNGNTFTKFYQGAIDSNPQVATDVRHHYLSDQVESLLAGKAMSTKSVPPLGCLVRKK